MKIIRENLIICICLLICAIIISLAIYFQPLKIIENKVEIASPTKPIHARCEIDWNSDNRECQWKTDDIILPKPCKLNIEILPCYHCSYERKLLEFIIDQRFCEDVEMSQTTFMNPEQVFFELYGERHGSSDNFEDEEMIRLFKKK